MADIRTEFRSDLLDRAIAVPSPTQRDRWVYQLSPTLLGLAIAMAVVFPWLCGRLLLLDWVSGPHRVVVPTSLWGLNGGLTGGLPFDIVANAFVRLVGAPGSWLLVAAVFPLATSSAARLVGGSLAGRLAAALLYAVNPFVLDRVYAGHIALLLGYAMLPFAVRAVLRAATGEPPWPAALWVGALVALSPHFAWILVPVAGAAVIWTVPRLRAARQVLIVGVAAAAISVYAVLGPLIAGGSPTNLGGQLAAYQTSGDPQVGLYVNVAGLYGFWRPGPVEPKNLLSGWYVLLAVVLAIAALGYVRALRDSSRRRLAGTVLLAGMAGYLLALGGQGPTGALFRWAYLHLPGFVVMREPEKFSMLIALAYAYGFGWGIEALFTLARARSGRVLTWALALALPFAYTPNLVDGLGGQVGGSRYPPSWTVAARVVAGGGTALMFPWHEYLAQPFTGGRTVANLTADFFAIPVITGDNPGTGYGFAQVGGEGAFIASLVENGSQTTHAGALLADLGVRWIVLDKVDDWRSYAWLNRQRDLRPVLDRPSIEVFRNEVPVYSAIRVQDLRVIHSSVALLNSNQQLISQPAVTEAEARRLGLNPRLRRNQLEATQVIQQSPVSYRIAAGRPGWVTLPIAYQAGWSADGHPAVPLATGTMAVRVGRTATSLVFTPWRSVRWVELTSVITSLVVLALDLLTRRRGLRVKART